jgi:2-keto-4-pentenoate hydratase/2-oxohepta-3-ene-1,7-dioic acid hydratase in catechol pathway
MKWCRFQIGAQVSHGIVEDDTVIEVAGSPFGEYSVSRTTYRLDRVKFLAPVIPPILYAAGPNYRGHLEGMAKRRGEPPRYPGRPEPKLRSPRAIIGPGDSIVVPKESTGAVQPEGQLAVVIGRRVLSSADQIWDTATWIHEMSKTTTLHPGDVLWMGTEGADGDMVPGDVIEVEIGGIGTLRNPIVAET